MAKRKAATTALRVVALGCGQPKKSMGWFHIKQILADPRAQLVAVVEPWYLGPGAGSLGSEAFDSFCQEIKAVHPNVLLCASAQELPVLRTEADGPVLAVIAGRTQDAPKLFCAACERGASHVYLEKPGAESAAELEELQAFAEERGVATVVGYNKNVSDYVQSALAELERLAADGESVRVSLEHNNAFKGDEDLLAFVTGPGKEGLVHNMSCHELALAATLFGVSRERVESVTLEPEHSELFAAVGGRDWKRVSFRLGLRGAEGPAAPLRRRLPELRLLADRCGGNYSRVCVEGRRGSSSSFRLPTPEQEAQVEEALARDPEVRPYFLQQAADYERLRGGFLQHILEGHKGTPDGVVDLAAAVKTLHLADMLAVALRECHASGEPWTWRP